MARQWLIADQDDVALLCEEVSAGEVPDQRFIDLGIFEPELFDLLGQWQLRDCHLVLDRPGVRPLSRTVASGCSDQWRIHWQPFAGSLSLISACRSSPIIL
jgi:hypothetical protein